MLAWILKRWRTWSDRNADFDANWPADDIVTFATIYWVNQAIGSSIRAYKNASLYPPKPVNDLKPYVQAPAGFTFLLGDSSLGAESPEERVEIFKAGGGQFYADVRDINVHEKGGHFGPYENPNGVCVSAERAAIDKSVPWGGHAVQRGTSHGTDPPGFPRRNAPFPRRNAPAGGPGGEAVGRPQHSGGVVVDAARGRRVE